MSVTGGIGLFDTSGGLDSLAGLGTGLGAGNDDTLLGSSDPNEGLSSADIALVNSTYADPTNTGDSGSTQNVSTPSTASKNNPETAGSLNTGATLNTALGALFAGFTLASQPKNTPKTVTATIGGTTVTSGASAGGALSILGTTSAQQSSSLLLIVGVIALIIFLKYRS